MLTRCYVMLMLQSVCPHANIQILMVPKSHVDKATQDQDKDQGQVLGQEQDQDWAQSHSLRFTSTDLVLFSTNPGFSKFGGETLWNL